MDIDSASTNEFFTSHSSSTSDETGNVTLVAEEICMAVVPLSAESPVRAPQPARYPVESPHVKTPRKWRRPADPTPREIAVESARIRETWSEATYRERAGLGRRRSWQVLRCRVLLPAEFDSPLE